MYFEGQPRTGVKNRLAHLRDSARVSPRVSGAFEPLGGVGAPVVDCPQPCAQCALPTAAQCGAALRQAIRTAVRLASNAANKVDTAISVAPAARDADARRTARFFRCFFGHDPSRPVPWAGNEASGVSVAKRFRAAAHELNGGRRVIYRCQPTQVGCGQQDQPCCNPNENAWFHPDLRNTINLCAPFWAADRNIRAGILIHEMLHMLFEHLQDEDQGRIRNACYEAFALRLAGVAPDPFDVCNCRGTPCPPDPVAACPP